MIAAMQTKISYEQFLEWTGEDQPFPFREGKRLGLSWGGAG